MREQKTLTPQASHQAGTKPTLQSELASVGEGIVSRLSSVFPHKIGITDVSGNIVADSDLANFDKYVPSASTAVQKGTHVNLPSGELDDTSGWAIPLRHQERIYGTIIVRNNPAPEQDVVPVVKSLAELLLYQMLVMDKVVQENRVLDKFFYDLLENEQPHDKLLRDSSFFNSQYFQFNLEQPCIAITIILNNFWKDVFGGQPILPTDEHKLTLVKDKIAESLTSNLSLKNAVIAYLGQDEFAALLPYTIPEPESKKEKKKSKKESIFAREDLENAAEELEEKFDRQAALGIGQYYPAISGLIKSYQGAKQAARLGSKLTPKQKVYYYTDMLLPIMLEQSDEELKKQFIDYELSELLNHPDLVETLSTHFDSNLNLKKTAYELGIHKNTLYYRLDKIKKILNVDPQEFHQAIKLKTALYLWNIEKEDGE